MPYLGILPVVNLLEVAKNPRLDMKFKNIMVPFTPVKVEEYMEAHYSHCCIRGLFTD
jgi:hypothetical protein